MLRPTHKRYAYYLRYDGESPDGQWCIIDMGNKGYFDYADPIVFTFPHDENDPLYPPAGFRMEYERLLNETGYKPKPFVNVVEIAAANEDCSWDQPCKYGHRVESHAVYCHNDEWLYSPRKCSRNRTDYKHEDCEGYSPNKGIGHE